MAEAAAVIPMQSKYKLLEARIQRGEQRNTTWSVVVPHGVPYERVLEPDFWVHVIGAKSIQPGDKIEVAPDEGSYVAMLYVRDCGPAWGAKVGQVWKCDFDELSVPAGDATPGYKVEWRGLADKHVVIREKDGAVIARGIKSRNDAQQQLLDHIKSITG